jgi:hypothetical protein
MAVGLPVFASHIERVGVVVPHVRFGDDNIERLPGARIDAAIGSVAMSCRGSSLDSESGECANSGTVSSRVPVVPLRCSFAPDFRTRSISDVSVSRRGHRRIISTPAWA